MSRGTHPGTLRDLARRFLRQRDGVAIIEFAMLMPVLLLALFGTFAIGHYYFERDNLRDVLRGASRSAMLSNADTSAAIREKFVTKLTDAGIDATKLTVSLVSDPSGNVAKVMLPWTMEVSIPMMDPLTMDEEFHVDIPLP